MHFHLPTPLHGWRELAGEVGIIVVGVLIALGAEQMVERVSWNTHVADARTDLRSELQDNLFATEERIRFKNCVEQQLKGLDTLIENPPERPWTFGAQWVIRVWSSSAWDSALASGAVAHMRGKERADYAQIYSMVRTLHDLNLDEYKLDSELLMLGRGGTISEASRDRLHADVARLRGYNRLMSLGASQLRDRIIPAGIRMRGEDQQELASERCLKVGPFVQH